MNRRTPLGSAYRRKVRAAAFAVPRLGILAATTPAIATTPAQDGPTAGYHVTGGGASQTDSTGAPNVNTPVTPSGWQAVSTAAGDVTASHSARRAPDRPLNCHTPNEGSKMRRLTNRAGLCAAALAAVLLATGCSGASHGGSSDGSGEDTAHAAAGAKAGGSASRAGSLIQAGIKQADKHDAPGAEATFRKALQVEPGNKFAWFNLAVMAQRKGDRQTALADYGQALKNDPAFTPALYNKALTIQSSDPAQAEQLLRQAITADPKASTAYLHLGLILRKTDRRQARDAFGKAVALDPRLKRFVPEDFGGTGGDDSPGNGSAGAGG